MAKKENFQGRLLQEKKDLDSKIMNLQKFIETNEVFRSLPDFEKRDLAEQLQIMKHYAMILQSRINRI